MERRADWARAAKLRVEADLLEEAEEEDNEDDDEVKDAKAANEHEEGEPVDEAAGDQEEAGAEAEEEEEKEEDEIIELPSETCKRKLPSEHGRHYEGGSSSICMQQKREKLQAIHDQIERLNAVVQLAFSFTHVRLC